MPRFIFEETTKDAMLNWGMSKTEEAYKTIDEHKGEDLAGHERFGRREINKKMIGVGLLW